MKKNMGRFDRTLRLVAALIISGLLLSGVLKGTAAVVLAALAVVFVLTTFVGFCPLYVPLGADTKGKGGTRRIDA